MIRGLIHRARQMALGPMHRFRRDRRGIAVVEFALIVPTMVLIFLALGELANALETSRKVGMFTRAVADLFGRSSVDNAQKVFDAAKVILQPYDSGRATIRVSAMGVYKFSGTYYAAVCSSVAMNTSPRPRVTPNQGNRDQMQTPPAAFRYDNARYILTEVTMPYVPVLGSSLFKWITKQDAIRFEDTVSWPERPNAEIVLPGGQPCT